MTRDHMERSRVLLLCILLLATVYGCDADTNSAGDAPFDPNLSISHLEIDTLYLTETGMLWGRSFGTDISRLKLYRGSLPLPIIKSQDSFLYFGLPGSVESGSLRCYKNDQLAPGEVYLTIIPHGDGMPTHFDGFVPECGYVGETFVIYGDHLDLRIRDVNVRIGKTQLKIDSATKFGLYMTIPDGVTDDSVYVKFDKKERALGLFYRAERGASHRMLSSSFHQVLVKVTLPIVTNRIDDGKLTNEDWPFTIFDSIVHQQNGNVIYDGTSSNYSGERENIRDTTRVSFELTKLANDMISGTFTIAVERINSIGQLNWVEIRLRLTDAVCRTHDGRTQILASAFLDPNSITLYDYNAIDFYNGQKTMYALKEVLPIVRGLEGGFISLEFQ
jgi:hypothetical protein